MLASPFRFEPNLSDAEFAMIGRLSLKWSHIEHFIGNCLKVMLRLSDAEAVIIVFPLNLEQRLRRLNALADQMILSKEAVAALSELQAIMKGIQYVRNNVVHAIVSESHDGEHKFHLRSKQRDLSKEQIFSTDEITNYAAHAAIALRYALGLKDFPGAEWPLPDRPEIPEFLRELIPTRKK